ncbi:hypothetical protein A3C98_03515 [Candidatus Roizmanbacteria bacterium RIFCSPHIGHO2_02_FULL_37_15]|uniref:Uncharacterized protein n=1 Tax=Candidatus Roizmanbacteria bacterium RIFCSPLOWO2_01_FULL_37_16 TaxID=1802058 RepID=A0A1F7IIV1_9BACT|nr:MAG: hypothetical protein A2859_05210 [Candidatus Roizmanbacteria bacterium RIFCSPHIGHO2_01_FULL_37_16b]OGK20441.1 MAG: hypothetical protein A3C98_03515 [Candidatus Roizmanbacteria bacterium RIFCSPHIGHO2_02_FULL_37_15]OGK34042.1 MAG: hypothetical protein A3F57_02465 [Candidatus Roizmanbacteria bacterium RIFCSPHIGHO2_12_FULL_36_11]OGK43292.1 MAG: hypothetical protein A3B40_02260 [Candidatus Roizmanbacteria bacterium RIFCSPLOWO2_01_FULL_37_16]
MLNQNLVYVGVTLSAIGALSYLINVIRGKIKPNKVSYFLWSLAPIIAFAAEIKQGVGLQSLMTLSVGIFPLAIFFASYLNRKAYWKLNRFDLTCGALSLIGLVLWQVTKVGNIAIFFSIISDGLAYVPTIAKAYKFPETESAWPWLADSINGLLTLLTITTWNFANFGFPLFFLIISLLVYIPVQFKLGKSLNKITS